MEAQCIRHGDLVLWKTEIPTKGLKTIPGNALATGSATGHSHKFVPAKNAKQYDRGDGTRLLVVSGDGKAPVRLVHEEHEDIRLENGDYLVTHKRQYDRDNGWTNVVD